MSDVMMVPLVDGCPDTPGAILERQRGRIGAASIPMEPSAEMSWFDLSLREQLLAGSAMALTFAVFFVAGLQLGGHW
ncbi:MAG: hypothetical protein IH582_11335 [Afipia sp.]|nr:hypothetical protein [Afipia sp.]